jgi:hypothetical protein
MNSIVTTKAASQAIIWFFEKKTTTVYKSLGGMEENLWATHPHCTSSLLRFFLFHILDMDHGKL